MFCGFLRLTEKGIVSWQKKYEDTQTVCAQAESDGDWKMILLSRKRNVCYRFVKMRVADELPGRLTVVCCMYLLRRDISNPCQFLSSIRRKREIHGRGKQWGSVLASFMAIYHYNRTRVNILRYPGKRYILIHSKTMTSHLHNSVPLRVSPFSKGEKKLNMTSRQSNSGWVCFRESLQARAAYHFSTIREADIR